ncbi:MAG: sulfatase-like hydrolase/transferase [Luteolibacter sp.]
MNLFRLLFFPLLFVASAGARPALEKPNLIVILLDDAGYADFSHTGHPTIETPSISKMAAEGLNFTQFYSASPSCTASRYGLLTGRNPRRSGLRWVLGPTDTRYIHPSEVTLAEGLKSQGYATGIFGKWHLGTPNSSNSYTPDALPLAHGFDQWIGTNVSHDYADGKLMRSNPAGTDPISGYETLATNLGTVGALPTVKTLTGRYKDAAVSFIHANHDKPFFAYIAVNFPHLQIAASDEFSGLSLRGLLGDTMGEIDNLAGSVRQALEEENIASNTLVIITSDNGHWIKYQNTASDSLYGEARIHIGSSKPFRDGKGSTWEGGLRVPGVWWWPGVIPPRSVSRQPASSLDVLPTVFSLAGVPLPSGRTLDGRDLRPYLNPTLFTGTVPEFQFIYTGNEYNPTYAARKGPWKLHTHLYSQTGDNYGFAANSDARTALSQPILFNVEADPPERYNVAAGNPAVVTSLQSLLSTFNASVNSEQTFWGPPP